MWASKHSLIGRDRLEGHGGVTALAEVRGHEGGEHCFANTSIVAGDQDDAFRRFGIGTFEHRINIGYYRGLWDAIGGSLGEAVSLYLETSVAIARVTFKLALDPFASRADTTARRDGGLILSGKS